MPGEDDAAARRRVRDPGPSCSARTSARCAASSTPHQLEFTVDGERVHLAELRRRRRLQGHPRQPDRGRRRRRRARARAPAAQGRPARDRRRVHRARADAEPLAAAAVHPQLDTTRSTPSGYPHIDAFTLTGPFNPTGPGRHAEPPPDLHLPPGDARPRRSRARAASSRRWRAAPIAARITADDLERLMEFYATGRKAGNFERGIQLALQRMLASPKFVLPRRARSRRARRPARCIGSATSSWRRGCRSSCGAAFPTTSCSSWPRQGRLHTPAVLRAAGAAHAGRSEGRRRWSTNFAGQWLYLRNLKNMQPNS